VQKTRVYSLPGEGLVSSWPANNTDLPPTGIDLSGSGAVLGQVFARGTAAANPDVNPVSTLNGVALGWLDNDHVLVNQYKAVGNGGKESNGDTILQLHWICARLCDTSEVALHTGPDAGPDLCAELNTIFSVSGSAGIWASADSFRGVGAVAGSNVIFASGHEVLALPR
jgi:hypothetical protein